MSQIYGKIFKEGPLSQTHTKIIELVGSHKEVLELGSSTGYLTKAFLENKCTVDIVEIDQNDAREAKKFARESHIGSLEEDQFLRKIKRHYDVIVAADILEHLKDPGMTLKTIKKNLKITGFILVSLPNIACWVIRRDLFFKGQFDYKESGILDKSHLKFFTYYSSQNLLKNSGFIITNILSIEVSYPLKELVLKFRRPGRIINKYITNVLVKLCPNFSTSHLLIKAKING